MKDNFINKFFLLVLLFVMCFIRGEVVFAAALNIGSLLEEIINYILTLAKIGAGIIIVVGGYYMVTSAGNPNQFKTGQKIILYGAIGFIIILLAQGLAKEIIDIIIKREE